MELAATDDLEMKVGGSAGRFEHGRDSMERDQLADEERLERLPGLPVGAEDPLLGADKTDLDLVSREPSELGEKRRIRFGVGDDKVGPAKRASVDGLERASRRRSRLESPAILDERVVKRDERVEDDRSAGSDAPGRSEVEVAGVTDDQRIEICSRTPEELCLRTRQAGAKNGAVSTSSLPIRPPAPVIQAIFDSNAIRSNPPMPVAGAALVMDYCQNNDSPGD